MNIRYWWNRKFFPNRYLFLMFLPGLLYFIIFHYIPMGGVIIAFKDYSPWTGILKSPWVGLSHFQSFFSSPYAWRIIRNTLLLNIYSLLFGFPIPIIFALLLNELSSELYKRTIQTVTYFPFFLSMPIVAGLVVQLLSPSSGVINIILMKWFGREEPIYFLTKPEWFRSIYITANIWRGLGYSAIIYLAALTSIDPTLYEAAIIDGANRWQRVRFITLPGLAPTITILLILSMGHILSVGIDLILLLYNPMTYETADVIGTFVYRRGIAGIGGAPELSLGAAVGLFQSAVGLVTILLVNSIARKISETSLW